MTIADKLTQLNTIKQDIKTAINNKGGSVANNFSTYAAEITALPVTSSGTIVFGKAEVITVNPVDSAMKTIPAHALRGWTAPTGLVLGEGIETLSDYAFNGWSSAVSLSLPSTLKTLGQFALAGWSAFTGTITVPDAVTSIGTSACQGNTLMTGFKIGNNVASLQTGVLASSPALKTLEIGTGVTSIAANFLTQGGAVTTIIVRATTPPTVNSSGTFFSGIPASAAIKVPAASVDAYKAATGWSVFAAKIVAI